MLFGAKIAPLQDLIIAEFYQVIPPSIRFHFQYFCCQPVSGEKPSAEYNISANYRVSAKYARKSLAMMKGADVLVLSPSR